jgi:hypothetical protein
MYFLFLIYLRWTSHFDMFDYRLLSPASFLIFLSILSFIEKEQNEHLFKNFKQVLFVSAIMSILINSGFFDIARNENSLTYPKTVTRISRFYEKVDDNSIILCGDLHLQYLRPDIQVLSIKNKPLFESDESFQQLLLRSGFGGKRAIYLDVNRAPLNYSKDLDSFRRLDGNDSLIKLN